MKRKGSTLSRLLTVGLACMYRDLHFDVVLHRNSRGTRYSERLVMAAGRRRDDDRERGRIRPCI